MPNSALMKKADAVTASVVKAVVDDEAKLTRVKAPPGAGKTRLTREVIRAALDTEVSTLVAVQTNAQAVDLVTSMAELLREKRSPQRFGYWPSGEAQEEFADEIDALRTHPNVTVCGSTAEANNGPEVIVAVAAKWAWHACAYIQAQRLTRTFTLGVVDEAYQMRAGALARFGAMIDRLLLIGDPGQLEPFTTIDDARWMGLEASVLTPAPRAVQALRGDDITPFELPASLRLDARAAPVVRECFYPDLPFQAVVQLGEREIKLAPVRRKRDRAVRAADAVLDRAAESGWALLQLPPMVTVRDDPLLADAIALLVSRLLARSPKVRASWPPGLRRGAPLAASGIAVATAHRDQRDRVRERLAPLPAAAGITVDTANRLQGREFDVVIAWHPLSGRIDASEFHLDTGRLCVMASRHRQACILVTREGIGDLLDDHLPSGLRPRSAVEDREHDGWIAHRRLLEHLGAQTVEAP